MKLITRMRHQTAAQKNENPALNLHRQRKTSSRDTYMFVSQMNKLIEENFPEGDVLHIKDTFPDGDVLNIESSYPDGDVLHLETIFKAAWCAV